ncbi:MAG: AMP-binding protein [Paracoccaceae bacterium]|nr:AMP-binding protein [Paracoccaceae bacterium]
MSIANAVLAVAARQPDHPAIVWEGGRLTYSGLADQVDRIAGGLMTRHGLKPGQRVAMAMENCPEFLPVLLGVWRAGLVAIPINAKLHPREFAWIFANSAAALVFATPALASKLETALPVVPTNSGDYAALTSAEAVPAPETDLGDLAWIFYTSGTTGRPKGAMLTHRNLLALSHAYFADVDFIGPEDIRIHSAPMSHGSGLYALPFLLRGAQNLILRGSFDPERIFKTLRNHRNVSFFAAPTMITRMLAHPDAGGEARGLKTLEYGGAPMYVSDLKRGLELFGPTLYQVYGQGESPMTITNITKDQHAETWRDDYDALLGSVGYARTAVDVQIIDPDGAPLPAGEIGEIATKSDNVMAGYLDNLEATAKAIRDGWLMTGDLGVMDETGMLTLKDRSKDVIISGGSNIYPREIEEVLLTSPAIHEVAVVSRPHADWGEEVVAFVVGDAEPEAMDRLCLDNLARFKRPKRYEFVDALPKNNYGKVVKTELRERLKGGSQ